MSHKFLYEELKSADYDRYLLALFAPEKVRDGLVALFLLNHEIAKTRDMVTDTNLGLIRLQWWRDEIGKIYGGRACGQIPVLSTLAPYLYAQTVPQAWFHDLLYAREFDLMDKAPENWEGLCHYAEFITLPLNRIALQIMGEEADEAEKRAISQIYGLFECIRSVPKMLSNRRCFIPESLLMERSLTPQKIIDFNHKREVVQAVETMCEMIKPYNLPKNHFMKRQQRIAFMYLKKLKNNDFDVFSPSMQTPPAFLALRLATGL